MFQARSDVESRTSSFCGNRENEGQRCRHGGIPIIIETSPEGRANVPFSRAPDEERTQNNAPSFVNCVLSERNCSSGSATAGRDDSFPSISGLAVGLKKRNITDRPGTPPETTCSCSKLENIQEQLKDLSVRLQRLEDKVGSDLEGIYEILISSKGKMNERDSVV